MYSSNVVDATASSLLEHPPWGADQYTEWKTILPAKYLQLPYNVANLGEMDAHTAVGLDHNLVDAGTNKLAILGMRSRRRAVSISAHDLLAAHVLKITYSKLSTATVVPAAIPYVPSSCTLVAAVLLVY